MCMQDFPSGDALQQHFELKHGDGAQPQAPPPQQQKQVPQKPAPEKPVQQGKPQDAVSLQKQLYTFSTFPVIDFNVIVFNSFFG